MLRRLAIFAGAFTWRRQRGRGEHEIAGAEVVDGVANLVAKSLVDRGFGGAGAHYRLLDTTRAYALEKLTESGESTRRRAGTPNTISIF